MSDIGAGLGSLIEGGLFARVLDPESGAKERHPDDPEDCLNCGTKLSGAYCHACGQSSHVHRTIAAFIHDLLHGALHLEGKIWRTLPMLVLRPGRLTRRYIDGARARFVSPMALFLFSVFLMFAVFQVLGISAPTSIEAPSDVQAEIEAGVSDATADRDSLAAELEGMAQDDPMHDRAERRLAEADTILAGFQNIQSISLSDDQRTNLTINPTGISFIDDGIGKKWRENPSLMLYKLQASSYKFSWALIPISLPFVWLLFVGMRRFRGYDHAIFITYSLSFMTLLFITLSLIGAAGLAGEWIFLAITAIIPLHIYRQLRGTYGLSRLSSIWRLLVLLVFIVIILLIFLQLLLLMGAF